MKFSSGAGISPDRRGRTASLRPVTTVASKKTNSGSSVAKAGKISFKSAMESIAKITKRKPKKKSFLCRYKKDLKRARIAKKVHADKVIRALNAKVPDEIWLNIFGNLHYPDLKNVAKVSNQFKTIVEGATYDKALHRYQPVVNELGTKVNLHPMMFELCRCMGTNPTMAKVEQEHRVDKKTIHIGKIMQTYHTGKHLAEQLTEPAVTVLHIVNNNSTMIRKRVIKESGITTYDLLKGIWDSMSAKEKKSGWPTSGGWTLRELCTTCVKEGNILPIPPCLPVSADTLGLKHDKHLTLRIRINFKDSSMEMAARIAAARGA